MHIRAESSAMEVPLQYSPHVTSAHLTNAADILTGVNDISVDTVKRENITKLLMGPPDSIVELRFIRPVDR